MMRDYNQIFETVNLGLIILDRKLRITGWNRWLELHSGISADEIVGQKICDVFPSLAQGSFVRTVKGVFAFGNYASYSQKLHKYLIPLRSSHGADQTMPYMQQSCTFGPLRDEQKEIVSVYITIQDVTDFVMYEQKLVQMARVDGLTGVYNRRYLDMRLKEELDRSRRHGNSFSLLILDIDHFKTINDRHGHLCGDYVLRDLARKLQQQLRTTDIIGRYGGEEFCCLLPETSLQQALIFAERCRDKIAKELFSCDGQTIRITISLGATEQQDGDTLEGIVRRADVALYEAKHGGRNLVRWKEPSDEVGGDA